MINSLLNRQSDTNAVAEALEHNAANVKSNINVFVLRRLEPMVTKKFMYIRTAA